MNILQLVSSSRTSGAEKNVILLSKRLMQRGHNVLAICPPGWLPAELRAAGVNTVELPMRGRHALKAGLQISKVVKDHNIDIVNAHLTRATYIGYLSGILARVPVISTVHIWSRDISYRYLSRGNLWLVAVSDYIRKDLIARGAPADRVQTIYNSTEIGEMNPADTALRSMVRTDLDIPPDSVIVGMVGRVDRFKGAHILVEAAASVLNRCPNTYFAFVGKAEGTFLEELRQIAGSDRVWDHLRFVGLRNDVARYLAAMDIVTLPSVSEACSISIIEGMAMGKPVIATRAGGNLELVSDRETGLLVDRSAAAFAEAISELCADPELRARMGSAAGKKASVEFAADTMTRNTENLYSRVVDSRRITPRSGRRSVVA